MLKFPNLNLRKKPKRPKKLSLPRLQPKKPKNLPPKSLGNQGELQAKKLLQNKGYTFLTANFHTRYGEIDLIFRDGDTIVFVEVKTRTTAAKTLPQHAVGPRKLDHITRAAQMYLHQHQLFDHPSRIDVVAIINSPQLQITHLQNVTGY